MERKVRSKWIHIRVNETEFKKIEGFWKASTCNKLSDYARTILLNKPVIIKYRNGSADEFLAEMIKLKNELSAIGNNFNQAVHRLHILDRIPDIKTWLLLNEPLKQSFLKKVEEIRLTTIQIYKVWLQK